MTPQARPEPGQPRSWHFPAFERRDVPGGQVIACDLPGRPLAVVSLLLDAGAVREPTGREGVAELAARALSEGTKQRDAQAFAVAGERLGATWRAAADWDSLRCGFEVPAAELGAAAELLTEAVREPALTADTLARIREERIDEVGIDRSQPGVRAVEAFAAEVFDPASRYARPDAGDVASLSAITDDDIRTFYDDRIAQGDATLILAGNLSKVDVDRVATTVLDGRQKTDQPSTVAGQPGGTGRRVVIVDRPGAVQSMLVVGHDGPPRRIDDYVPMTMMAMVLGGMFGSRLNLKLREEKGYTYGAFAGFDARRDGGVFLARAAVQSEVTLPALRDLVEQLERTHAEGVTDAELDQARSYRAGVFPINFAAVNAVASGLGDLVVHGFPDDHFDRLREAITAVGKDAVDAAAGSRLRPDDLVTVVVGDAAPIRAELETAGLGPVTVVRDEE
ncbi:MAG TPA: pitrilysin family protein [Mycobacteriales bacterium]|nr:pitrilysin family protein [Mycobacteriales bacterium]